MSVESDTEKVKNRIYSIFEIRKIQIYAISLYYAAEALNEFRANQSSNLYWNNQTYQAKDHVFTKAFRTGGDTIGWRIAHGMDYGVYLELANDRKHEALRPIIERFKDEYFLDCAKLYDDKPEAPR